MSTGSADTAADPHSGTLQALAGVLGEAGFTTAIPRQPARPRGRPDRLMDALRTLKDRRGFASLAELGATDYLKYPGRRGARFEVHYCLLNMDTRERIVVKAGVDDPDPVLPSAMPLWLGADWMEREVFDMYGIRFDGHPDLRRILMPDEFAWRTRCARTIRCGAGANATTSHG